MLIISHYSLLPLFRNLVQVLIIELYLLASVIYTLIVKNLSPFKDHFKGVGLLYDDWNILVDSINNFVSHLKVLDSFYNSWSCLMFLRLTLIRILMKNYFSQAICRVNPQSVLPIVIKTFNKLISFRKL